MAGRPTKLTSELIDAIAVEILDGAPLSRVGWLFGITPQTIFSWMRRGVREPRSRYGQFLYTIKKAQADWEMECVRGIKASKKGWVSLAWLLERRLAPDYAKRDQVNLAKVNDRIKALERELRAAKAGKKA
jgi:hypothetical protein